MQLTEVSTGLATGQGSVAQPSYPVTSSTSGEMIEQASSVLNPNTHNQQTNNMNELGDQTAALNMKDKKKKNKIVYAPSRLQAAPVVGRRSSLTNSGPKSSVMSIKVGTFVSATSEYFAHFAQDHLTAASSSHKKKADQAAQDTTSSGFTAGELSGLGIFSSMATAGLFPQDAPAQPLRVQAAIPTTASDVYYK